MKTLKKLLLVIILLTVSGCTNTPSNYQAFPLSDLQTDFPQTDTLNFEKVNTYNIFSHNAIEVSDSTLWTFNMGGDEIGYCYDLNTGKEISTIASFGRAKNELDNDYSSINIGRDSIFFFYEGEKMIKSFSMKDIKNNVPLGERRPTITHIPDSLNATLINKLPNGAFLMTLSPILRHGKQDFNPYSLALVHNNEIRTYATINFNSYNLVMDKENPLSANEFIKANYAYGEISTKNNNMAVLSVNNQVILYTLNLLNGKVMNEKRYTEMKCETNGYTSNNDLELSITNIDSNDKYIFCIIKGYMNKKDKDNKEIEKRKQMLLIFDWQLNPIKKYELPYESICFFPIDNTTYIYQNVSNSEGATLYKAKINL